MGSPRNWGPFLGPQYITAPLYIAPKRDPNLENCPSRVFVWRTEVLLPAFASALEAPLSRTTFQLAVPPIDDFSDGGRIVWNVAVLAAAQPDPAHSNGCIYFIDLRAILCGLTWAYTADGTVSTALIKGQCARPAAGGHRVRPVQADDQDIVAVWPGEVLYEKGGLAGLGI